MRDDKTNRDHEPDDPEQDNCADDLRTRETHVVLIKMSDEPQVVASGLAAGYRLLPRGVSPTLNNAQALSTN